GGGLGGRGVAGVPGGAVVNGGGGGGGAAGGGGGGRIAGRGGPRRRCCGAFGGERALADRVDGGDLVVVGGAVGEAGVGVAGGGAEGGEEGFAAGWGGAAAVVPGQSGAACRPLVPVERDGAVPGGGGGSG